MAHRHPLGDDPVERAATVHDVPADALHELLDRFDEDVGRRLQTILDHRELDLREDRRIVDRDPERLTLDVDSATFRLPFAQVDWDDHAPALADARLDHEQARSVLQDAVVDAHRTHAADANVDVDGDARIPLTAWLPRVYELEAGGMSLQEARAHVLRDGGLTQKEVRDWMGLPSTNAAKNALHRGDEKLRAARRLLDAAEDG